MCARAWRRSAVAGGRRQQTVFAYMVHMLFYGCLALGPANRSPPPQPPRPRVYYELLLLLIRSKLSALVSVDRNSALRPTISARPIPLANPRAANHGRRNAKEHQAVAKIGLPRAHLSSDEKAGYARQQCATNVRTT